MKEGLCPDMPFLVNDYIASTKRMMLTLEEQGAYVLLLAHAWNDHDCCLPDDDVVLARISELGKKWLKSASRIRACFEVHPTRAGYIYNRRQFAEREKQTRRLDASKRSAQAGAAGRWKNKTSNAAAMRPHNGGNAEGDAESMRKNASYSSLVPPPSSPVLFEDLETTSLASSAAVAHEILAYWNTKGQLQKARSIAGKRLASARARLKDTFFVEHWRAAIDRASLSRFCTGRVPTRDHPNGWNADIDWFLRPETVTKIIEGKYDDRTAQTGANSEHTGEF